PDQRQDLALHGLVTGDYFAFAEYVLAAVEVADEAAGLFHHQQAGRHVPGRKVALPKHVEAPGRDPGEIERRSAEPAQPRDFFLHGRELLAKQREITAAEVRQAAGDDRLGEAAARRDAHPLVVEEGALAALGDEQLLVRGIVDDAGDDRALALQRDRDGELRN